MRKVEKVMRKVPTTLYLDPSVRRALEELAKNDNRSVSNYCITLLMDAIRNKVA